MVVTIDRYEELLPLAHGAAAAVADVMAAASAHVTLIVGDQFCDLVNVGDLSPGMVTFPERQYYPLDSYPWATRQLQGHRGYLSTDDSAVVREYTEQTPYEVPASFMGVPIVAQGQVFGELFLTRNTAQPPFTSEDLELVMDLATVIGGRIPAVLE
jgi:GAF domain-containing protein